jgi:hypothetical protein
VLLATLIGCSPGPFDDAEAALVFEALGSVNGDTWARIWADTVPDVDLGGDDTAVVREKSLTYTGSAGGGTITGTFDGPGSWTGDVTVDGTYALALDDASATWTLAVNWDAVRWSDLRLDGSFTWDVVAAVDAAAILTQTSTFTGEMTAHGGALGTGALDYTTGTTYGGGRYLSSASGTVGDTDISSSWDASDAFGL